MIINGVLAEICKAPYLGSGEQDYVVLYTLVRAFNVKKVIETGTHQGASAIAIAQAIRDNGYVPTVWSIDNWSQAYGDFKDGDAMRQKALENLHRAGFPNDVHLMSGCSWTVAPSVLESEGPFDLAFIDGNHGPEGVFGDMDAFKDKVPILVFHDATGGTVEAAIRSLEEDGWDCWRFPTRYAEGDGHAVGITACFRPAP